MNRARSSHIGCWLAALFFLLATSAAEAQTLVYRMDFKKSATSVNFEIFDQAFFVVDGLGGEGSFIFTYREDGRDFYVTSAGGGTLFFAVAPGQDKAVIRATAGTASGQSHYLATGDLNGRISVNLRGQRVSLGVAESLSGWVLASDPEEGVVFPSPDGTLGVAGFATLTASLDGGRTRDANRANLDVAQTVETLTAQLEREGYESGAPPAGEAETNGGSAVETGEVAPP